MRFPICYTIASDIHIPLGCAAPAKINLGLHVLRRRPDAFHDLSTVFYPLTWHDRLHVCDAGEITLTCSDPALSTGPQNLVIRAAAGLAEFGSSNLGAAMHLEKCLPIGAGLGGGSSDAAAALKLLGRLWELDICEDEWQRLALSLGSDVPFFLNPVPSHAQGRGELLSPLTKYVLPFAIVVAVPPVSVSTAWAFRQVVPREINREDLAVVVRSNDLDRWKRSLINDFEPIVRAAYPAVDRALQWLNSAGAVYVGLTGTGSAVYGVFARTADAEAAALEGAASGLRTWLESPSVSETNVT